MGLSPISDGIYAAGKTTSPGSTSTALAPIKGKPVKKQTSKRYLGEILLILRALEIPYEQEHLFALPNKRFRFDIAILDQKIAIEYEGLFSEKSGHTTIKGYVKDVQKYNLATILGWRILRYTAVNHTEVHNDILKLYKK